MATSLAVARAAFATPAMSGALWNSCLASPAAQFPGTFEPSLAHQPIRAPRPARQWRLYATRGEAGQEPAATSASPPASVSAPSAAVKGAPNQESAAPAAEARSWGFGFTKQNELFVGRVAMLGFAASLLGEAVTGQGILLQLNLETGIPVYEAEPLLLFFILFNMLGAVGALGDRGKFVLEPVKPPVPDSEGGWRKALGLVENGPVLGFTKSNELFVGRVAQLGFAASLVGEVITGKGALAQLNIETGVPVAEIEPLVILGIMLLILSAINPGTGKFINDDEVGK